MGAVSIRLVTIDRPNPIVTVALGLLALTSDGMTAAQDWPTYRDARGRFEFRYSPDYGTPRRGTDDGFGDRVAAMRFSGLTGLGGEAAVTKGRVVLDLQAAGGLYDEISLQVFPDAIRGRIEAILPPITLENICAILGQQDHLPAGAGLDPKVAEAARSVDRVRNVDPKVVQCRRSGSVVTFHKEATFISGAARARQHLYGAVRFLAPPYSSFQFVRGALEPPAGGALEAITRMVESFTVK
jgi:hypothetical protein